MDKKPWGCQVFGKIKKEETPADPALPPDTRDKCHCFLKEAYTVCQNLTSLNLTAAVQSGFEIMHYLYGVRRAFFQYLIFHAKFMHKVIDCFESTFLIFCTDTFLIPEKQIIELDIHYLRKGFPVTAAVLADLEDISENLHNIGKVMPALE